MTQREPKKSETLEVRLPHETKTAFMDACRSNGVSASDVVRGSIGRYLKAGGSPLTRSRPVWFGSGAVILSAVGAALLAGSAQAAIDPRVSAVFQWTDADHNGSISPAEFAAALSNEPALGAVAIVMDTREPPPPGETRSALFRRLDADRDGCLAEGELSAASRVETIVSPAIALADANLDGRLTEGELAAYLTAQRAAGGVRNPAAGVGLMARGIISSLDRDGTGSVALADLSRSR